MKKTFKQRKQDMIGECLLTTIFALGIYSVGAMAWWATMQHDFYLGLIAAIFMTVIVFDYLVVTLTTIYDSYKSNEQWLTYKASKGLNQYVLGEWIK